METNCVIQENSAQPTLCIRKRVPVEALPETFGQAYNDILFYLNSLQEQPVGAPYAAYYNMDMSDLDVEIGFPVAKTLPGDEEILPSEIPAGRYASLIHTGSYDKIGEAYESLSTFIKGCGLSPSGVAYEFYLNDPGQTPPHELQTKIMFPLQFQLQS